MADFESKRVLVTGGSRGIGFAVARAFLDAGARVAVNGRTTQSVNDAVGRLDSGDRVIAAPGDVRTVTGCETIVTRAIGELGGLDVLVNSASKGGVVNMTRAMAMELVPDVRVNSVCPGYVDTDMVRRDYIDRQSDPTATERKLAAYSPMNRIATPAEIAAAVLYLASQEARFVTGIALPLDGGSSVGR